MLTSGRGGGHPARFLSTVNNGLIARIVEPGNPARPLPPSGSILRTDRADVEVTAFKLPQDGKGYIARLRDLSGHDGRVRLSSDLFKISAALRENMVEQPAPGLGLVVLDRGAASLPIKSYEIPGQPPAGRGRAHITNEAGRVP